jgi:protein subunit release factor B
MIGYSVFKVESTVMIKIPESDDDLLRECEIETFRSGGPGGQHVNKVETGVRLKHLPTGIVVTCREERSQYRNRMTCLGKLREEVERLNYRPAKRIATRRTRAAKQRTLEAKARRSQVKKLRSKPSATD